MKLKVNPPIALESTELYNGIKFYKGKTTTDGTNQSFKVYIQQDAFVLVRVLSTSGNARGRLMVLGVPWTAYIIFNQNHNTMPDVTLSGNINVGITFTWEDTDTYDYSVIELRL